MDSMERLKWAHRQPARDLIRFVRGGESDTMDDAEWMSVALELASRYEMVLNREELAQACCDCAIQRTSAEVPPTEVRTTFFGYPSVIPPVVAEACTAVTDAELAVIAGAQLPRNGFLGKARRLDGQSVDLEVVR